MKENDRNIFLGLATAKLASHLLYVEQKRGWERIRAHTRIMAHLKGPMFFIAQAINF